MKTIEERAKDAWNDAKNKAMTSTENIFSNGFIAGAQSEHEELTRWNSPECPPEEDKTVIVKYLNRGVELYSIGYYDKKYGWSAQDEVGFNKDNILGWREIHK